MRAALIVCVLTVAAFAPDRAAGQIVPPVPDRTPPSPRYSPPLTQVELERERRRRDEERRIPPLLSIAQHDQQGRLLPLEYPLEEAAVRAFEMDDEQRERVERLIDRRRRDIERWVIENYDDVSDLLRILASPLEQVSRDALIELVGRARQLRQPSLIRLLEDEGAVDARLARRMRQTARDYSMARRDDLQRRIDADDREALDRLSYRLAIREWTDEVAETHRRLMRQLAAQLDDLIFRLDFTAHEVEAVEPFMQRLRRAGEGERAAMAEAALGNLRPERRAQILRAAFPHLFENDEPTPDEQAPTTGRGG